MLKTFKELVREFWQTNKWIGIIFGLFVIIPIVAFRVGFLHEIYRELADPKWWASNLLSFVVFTIIVGFIVLLNEKHLEQKRRVKYEGWTLEQIGLKQVISPQDIFWVDVQKNESRYERWKFIKSAVSSICWIKTLSMEEAEKRWLCFDGKKYVIDYSKMKQQDVTTWNVDPLPDGWKMIEAKKTTRMEPVLVGDD